MADCIEIDAWGPVMAIAAKVMAVARGQRSDRDDADLPVVVRGCPEPSVVQRDGDQYCYAVAVSIPGAVALQQAFSGRLYDALVEETRWGLRYSIGGLQVVAERRRLTIEGFAPFDDDLVWPVQDVPIIDLEQLLDNLGVYYANETEQRQAVAAWLADNSPSWLLLYERLRDTGWLTET